MLTNLREQIIKHNLISPGDVVILGVSGGRDSMALLWGLWQLHQELSFQLVAAHFNHGIRGLEADRDQEFVADFAMNQGIPFVSTKVKMKELAAGANLENASRIYRYQWLNEVCDSHEKELGAAGKIATAHHLEDSCESQLLHLLRGCGIGGLRGIAAKSGRLIRPLVRISRSEIEEYLNQENIPWCDDSTNAEAIYTRNKLRLEVWPKLLEFNSNLPIMLGNLGEIAQAEDSLLQQLTASKMTEIFQSVPDGYVASCYQVQDEPLAIRRRLISWVWQQLTGNKQGLSFHHVEQVLNLKAGKMVYLPDNVYGKLEAGKIYMLDLKSLAETREKPKAFSPVPLVPGVFIWQDIGWAGVARAVHSQSSQPKSQDLTVNIPQEVAKGLVWRTRKPGDFMRLPGMAGRKKLQDLFVDKKIPAHERDSMLLLCQEQEVIWLPGIAVSSSFAQWQPAQDVFTISLRKI